MPERVPISTPTAPAPVGPYGQGMRVGDWLFTVGVVGNEPGTSQLVSGGAEAELSQAIRNLQSILAAGGSGLDRIVKATIYLADIQEEPAVGRRWYAAVPPPHPALTVVAVQGLPLGAHVEIECVAITGMGN